MDAPKILFAAAQGELDHIVSMRAKGMNIFTRDYDRRTALHLASSNGHVELVKYLLAQAKIKALSSKFEVVDYVQFRDRWGNNAYDDAVREGHTAVQALLNEHCQQKVKEEL